jgi:hypothetical protein
VVAIAVVLAFHSLPSLVSALSSPSATVCCSCAPPSLSPVKTLLRASSDPVYSFSVGNHRGPVTNADEYTE